MAFRIAQKKGASSEAVENIRMWAVQNAEGIRRVPFHPDEEYWCFHDGSEAVYSHETCLARVVSSGIRDQCVLCGGTWAGDVVLGVPRAQ